MLKKKRENDKRLSKRYFMKFSFVGQNGTFVPSNNGKPKIRK
jgi:hypothetical protein